MPLVSYRNLPAFASLRLEGLEVVGTPSPTRAPVRIGLLNLTPDAVLRATERQFMRLLAGYDDANVYVYPIAVATECRGEAARTHIAEHYESFESLESLELDALIVTGANPQTEELSGEAFWQPMIDVIDWARGRRCSILCSCLAVHAVMQEYFGVQRIELPQKRWGVFDHARIGAAHPLTAGLPDNWAAPHSHCYDISREQIEQSGGRVLVHSDVAGVHLAVTDGPQPFLLFQGHPEYDANSLLKEYKREVSRWFVGDRYDYPPHPENYFSPTCSSILHAYRGQLEDDRAQGRRQSEFPEDQLTPHLSNGWAASGTVVFHNWLRQIQQQIEEPAAAPAP